MVAHIAHTKRTALKAAAKARMKGYKASVFKTAKGWRISVTR